MMRYDASIRTWRAGPTERTKPSPVTRAISARRLDDLSVPADRLLAQEPHRLAVRLG